MNTDRQALTRMEVDWARVQAFSGLYFAIFLTLHVGATVSAILGKPAFTVVQHAGRAIYQFPVLEVGLGVAFFIHVLSAWKLRHRARIAVATNRRRRLQRYTGVFLLVFVAGHALATRGVSIAGNVDSGFDAVAFSIVWMPGWFLPYYVSLALAGIYHAWWGALTALARVGWQAPARLRSQLVFWVVPATSFVLIPLALASFSGVFGDIGDPMRSDYARYYLSLFGIE